MYSRKVLTAVVLTLVLAGLLTFGSGLENVQAQAQATNTPVESQSLPPNQPHLGLVYDGLEIADQQDGPCKALFKIPSTSPGGERVRELCTHGPDPAPPGVSIVRDAPPLSPSNVSLANLVQCDGNGSDGFRTQVIYARASDVPNRYNQYLTSFQQWAADADAIYRNSASDTGGVRHIRFVHDSTCLPVVQNVVLSPAGDDDFGNKINELGNMGYNRTDRKYMIFMDANIYCGIGTIDIGI